ncbi:unnamed protein product [Ranitomeya imitator]|uniref:Uncharacterized protein n=1 Tax=Ranitomeya imitator TaxID=111125 RepID=A0ABN9M840_9NEOB|nr:unnamed protein product [Ranitomeya imitator]
MPLTSEQAKVNNSSLIGLGYTQTLKPVPILALIWSSAGLYFFLIPTTQKINQQDLTLWRTYFSVDRTFRSISEGIKLTLSTLLDGKNINAGGHKLGLGLEFEA